MVRADRLGETLYIPVDGPVHVYAHEVDPVSLLTGDGRYILLHLGNDGHVHFKHRDDTTVNQRARAVLYDLTGVSMILTGPVVFTGLPGDRVYAAIQQLS